MRFWSLLSLVVLSLVVASAARAQTLGDPAPNKVFLSSWNMPAGVDELSDFSAQGKVVLLDWFGVYWGHCQTNAARFNQLQTQYETDGLEVLSLNHAHTDSEISTFVNTYGVSYRVARVVDDSGYTVPMYGTVFAIGRDGRLLWTGNATLVTDAMVESWVATPTSGEDDDDEEEGCAAGTSSTWLPPIAVLMLALAVLGVGRISRRQSTTDCRVR